MRQMSPLELGRGRRTRRDKVVDALVVVAFAARWYLLALVAFVLLASWAKTYGLAP